MDALRKLQEERYLEHLRKKEAAQAEQEAAQAAQEAAQAAQEANAAFHQKVLDKMEKYKHFTQFDWAAARLQCFIRTRQSRPRPSEQSEPVVVVDGVSYKFYSVASMLFDTHAAPFDSPHGKSAYVTVLMKIQSSANFASPDNQLSDFHQVVFLLSCIARNICPDVCILFGLFEFDLINQMLSLNLSDYPKLSRNIRLLNLLLNGQVPDWLFQHFPPGTDLEEFIDFFRQEVLSEMERIGSSQALLAETLLQPNPDDEIQCTNCQQVNLARRMFKRPQGRFYYCRQCAIIIGIFPDDF